MNQKKPQSLWPRDWELRQPYPLKWIVLLLIAAVLLAVSARRNALDAGFVETLQGMGHLVGLVPSSGIGMELKGRWDLYDFGHVSTILLVIFVTVFLLESFTHRLRHRLIG